MATEAKRAYLLLTGTAAALVAGLFLQAWAQASRPAFRQAASTQVASTQGVVDQAIIETEPASDPYVLECASITSGGDWLREDAVDRGFAVVGQPTVGVMTGSGYTLEVGTIPCLSSALFKIAGDVNGDGHVDVEDLLYLVDAFGSVTGDGNYDVRCDFNLDDSVDVVDLLTMVENFGLY